jgi:predicted dehydrogenase
MKKDKLGIALVGLGTYSSEELAPALQETKHCRLAGIVTGSTQKAKEWKEKYNLPEGNIYNYEHFDSIKDNPDIDIVYVVLPNAQHAEYTIRAARAGKHVICEKPMAITVEECEQMIKACAEAGVLLSIGYRLHFEPHNQAVMDARNNGTTGAIKKLAAGHGMDIEPGVWRLNKALAGGGPLMDVGIYCVQAAIYTVGEDPIAVTAKEGKKTDHSRFAEVEQSITWTMEFPGGALAECETSYAKESNYLRAEGDKGWIALEPAYKYEGIKGKTHQGLLQLPQVNQQAAQMDDFALCVKEKRPSPVPGEMGLRDVRILQAIYEAARTGSRVTLK